MKAGQSAAARAGAEGRVGGGRVFWLGWQLGLEAQFFGCLMIKVLG